MQQINLYLEQFKEKRVPFSAETLVFSFFGSLMFCFMATVVAYIMFVSSAAHLKQAKKELTKMQTAYAEAQQEFKIIALDNRLKSRIASMETRSNQNKQLLKYLDKRSIDNGSQSFSSMMKALSDIGVSGLWLKEVRFESAGEGLSLSGYALQPDAVPTYIKRLGEAEAFAGMQFKVFDLRRENDQLVFTLSSQRKENEMNEALLEVLSETVQSTEIK